MNIIQLSCPEGTRSLVKAATLSVVLLPHISNFNTFAQDGPPVPPVGPPTQPPREPTPEEREAQRKAHEAWLEKNLERFAPHLIKTVGQLAGADPLDGRLLSFEALLDRRFAA